MRFVDAGRAKGRVIAQTVRVTACEPPRRLAWVGHIPLLFRGLHWFSLEPVEDGTLLRHGEDLSGLVPLSFTRNRLDRQRRAYEEMNDALAARAAPPPG